MFCYKSILFFLFFILTPFQSLALDKQLEANVFSALPVMREVSSPFVEPERKHFKTVSARIFSRFGAYRSTYRKGHLHSGVDLKGAYGEKVHAIGPGQVFRNYWIFPNRAVAVLHHLPDGGAIYSAYVHIQDIKVKEGQQVDENTELGRLFNREEMRQARYRSPPHLHLEIRRSMTDNGRRSFSAMTMSSLMEYCLDPEPFLRSLMQK